MRDNARRSGGGGGGGGGVVTVVVVVMKVTKGDTQRGEVCDCERWRA